MLPDALALILTYNLDESQQIVVSYCVINKRNIQVFCHAFKPNL